VKISAKNLASIEKSKAIISNLTMVPTIGDIYRFVPARSLYLLRRHGFIKSGLKVGHANSLNYTDKFTLLVDSEAEGNYRSICLNAQISKLSLSSPQEDFRK